MVGIVSFSKEKKMIDLHSHVIYDIDDGAEDLEASLAILKKAESIGIAKIMATPHFTIGEDAFSFLQKRERRLAKIEEALADNKINISIKAGAEVYITDEIFNEENLKSLALGEGNVILSEFKYHSIKAERFLEYIDYILEDGLIPLIAHVERYSFIRHNSMLLNSLLSRGVLLQVNALSLYENSEEGEFARMLIDKKLVTVVASDIHHVPSNRFKAMEKLNEFDDKYIHDLLNKNPLMIFDNENFRR